MKIPLASTGLRDKDIAQIVAVLNSGQLTMGHRVRQFEQHMAAYLGVKHFVMVNSGSSANLIMLEALLRPTRSDPILHPGDSVLVPAIAWPTTVWPLIQLGMNPIFVDIDITTLGIDLIAASNIITGSGIPVKAIFPIHPLGLSLSSSLLHDFSRLHKVAILSDVCESLGSWIDGKHAGADSLVASFSFYFSHHITTMEGGGVATNDDLIADDLRSIRSHGWSRDRTDAPIWHAGFSDTDSRFMFVSTGFNVRPMEIQAAVGIEQLADLETFVKRRREIASFIAKETDDLPLSILGWESFEANPQGHSWMLLPIMVEDKKSSSRRIVIDSLSKNGIETRPVLTGNFVSQPAIQRITRQTLNPDQYPNASLISSTSFMVSCHHDLNDLQVEYLADQLRRSCESIDGA
jgi:CDP-6-deoxy-D-xylo-4-hexulose-3-dehydrase